MNDTTEHTLEIIAREALEWFTTKERGEETIVTLKDDAPEWVQDLVRSAHSGLFLPDDWRYSAIRLALYDIRDDSDQDASEWADRNVDTYNNDLIAWLGSNHNRIAYCDEALEEARPDDIMNLIRGGQYLESMEVFQLVVEALESELDDRENTEQHGG